jgi:hypothetical protein
MVYRHRTQKGKYMNFRSKGAYEKWKRGMFANMNPNKSVGRKVAKAKTKSRKRMQHRGVKDIKSGKAFCKDCKRKNVKLTDDRCKLCEKEFKTFKQPEKPKKSKVDIIGDNINENWRRFVESHWEWIKENKQDILADEYGDSAYIFVPFEKSTQEVNDVQINYPDYWRGTSRDNWVGQYPVDRNTTKQELLDVDMSEETAFYEDDLFDEED